MPVAKEKPKILVVDDEEELVEIYVSVFEGYAVEVFATIDSQQALKLVEEHTFAAVITDLQMPNVNGLQLIRALNASQQNVDCSIYIASGHLDHERIEKLEGLKIVELIPKPLDFQMLASKVWEKIKERHSTIRPNIYSKEIEQMFSSATKGVFNHYFGEQATVNYQYPFVKTELHKDSYVAALLPVFGKTCFGSAILGMNKEMLAGLLGALYGEDETFDDMVPYADVVGEMVNQISGRLKTDLWKSGIQISVGVPMLHFEDLDKLRHLVSGRPMVFPLSLGDRHAYSEMCFGDLTTGNSTPENPAFPIFCPKKAVA